MLERSGATPVEVHFNINYWKQIVKYLQQVKKKDILVIRNILAMVDYNVLRSEISSARRYRKLRNLELSTSGLRHSFPVSLYSELTGRIRGKIMSFEYPECNISIIRVIYSNDLLKWTNAI